MTVPPVARLAVIGVAGSLLAVGTAVYVAKSAPGDPSYGLKEAIGELRMALASDGESRNGRYLDEVNRDVAELSRLGRDGAPRGTIDQAAEQAITNERHAQAELSEQDEADPKVVSRYRKHRRTLVRVLDDADRPDVRESVRHVLQILPDPSRHHSTARFVD